MYFRVRGRQARPLGRDPKRPAGAEVALALLFLADDTGLNLATGMSIHAWFLPALGFFIQACAFIIPEFGAFNPEFFDALAAVETVVAC